MGVIGEDFDNDGDTDLVLLNNGGPARLLRNEVGSVSDWTGVILLDGAGAPALGAEVHRTTLSRDAGASAEQSMLTVRTASSYCSADDSRARLGGEASGSLTLRRPGRITLRLESPAAGRYSRFP